METTHKQRMPALLLAVSVLLTSCAKDLPEQTLENIEWEHARLLEYSIPLPRTPDSPSELGRYRHRMCTKTVAFPPDHSSISLMNIEARRHFGFDMVGWLIRPEIPGDVFCLLKTIETPYSLNIHRLLYLMWNDHPGIRIQIITFLADDDYYPKVRERIREDQRIYEYIRDNIRVLRDGKLVKPEVVTLGNTIRRPNPCAPRKLVRDLALTGYVPEGVSEEPAADQAQAPPASAAGTPAQAP